MKINIPHFNDEITIVKIYIKENEKVEKDQVLFDLEVGKGNHVVKSPKSGIISRIFVSLMEKVNSNDALCDLEVMNDEQTIDIFCPDFENGNELTVTKLLNKDEALKDEIILEVEVNKGSYKIKSPISGQITYHVKKGETLSPHTLIASIIEADVQINEEENNDYDVLIIGGGPGGYVAAIYAAQNNKKVVLIEKEELGGTCLNVGCIPTKALVKSSEVMHEASHGDVFGIHVEHVNADIKQMLKHKEDVIHQLVNGIHFLINKNNITLIKGCASFKDDHCVIVNNEEIKAKDIIIATGSKIATINIPGLDLPKVLNSTQALSYPHIPSSITIIGGGVIGMEFAFMYKNLGVDVHIVEYSPTLLSMIDFEASQEILTIAKNRGINVHLSSQVTAIEEINEHTVVTYLHQGNEYKLETDNVLYAIGRIPQLDGLNIENTSVTFNKKTYGIKVNEFMQTDVEHIYAIGDVTNIIQLAHVASHQGMIAVDHILGNKHPMHYHAVPNVIFTDPEIACVGLNEQDLINKDNYKISKFNFASNGKALTMNKGIGFVKIIEEIKTHTIVGATIIGPDASSLINTLTLAIHHYMDTNQLTEIIFPHPTTGEAIHEAALGLGLGSIHQ